MTRAWDVPMFCCFRGATSESLLPIWLSTLPARDLYKFPAEVFVQMLFGRQKAKWCILLCSGRWQKGSAEVSAGFIYPIHYTSGPCENLFIVGHSGEVSFLLIHDALMLCQKGRKIWVRYQLISNSWPLSHNFSSQTRKVAGTLPLSQKRES